MKTKTKRINLTAKRIAYFRSLDPKSMSPKKAGDLLAQIMMEHQSYYDVLWGRVIRRDKVAANKLGHLARLTLKSGRIPTSLHSILPPGI